MGGSCGCLDAHALCERSPHRQSRLVGDVWDLHSCHRAMAVRRVSCPFPQATDCVRQPQRKPRPMRSAKWRHSKRETSTLAENSKNHTEHHETLKHRPTCPPADGPVFRRIHLEQFARFRLLRRYGKRGVCVSKPTLHKKGSSSEGPPPNGDPFTSMETSWTSQTGQALQG